MVGGILKRAGKVLKDAKKAKKAQEASKFLQRKKTMGGVKAGSKEYPDWFKEWLLGSKLRARAATKPSEAKKKQQVKDFVNIRKRTKLTRSKKKFD